jgi:hypothetical protein
LFDDLPKRTLQFYKGGWRENWEEYQRSLGRHQNNKDWAEWLTGFGKYLEEAAAQYGVTAADKTNPGTIPYWPIPGRMLKDKSLSPERASLMAYLNDWFYKSLSSQSHASLPGLVMRAVALLPSDDPERRQWHFEKQRSDQILVTCLLCLAFVSEIEIEFRFGLVKRTQYIWRILVEHFGMARELYIPWYEDRLHAADA